MKNLDLEEKEEKYNLLKGIVTGVLLALMTLGVVTAVVLGTVGGAKSDKVIDKDDLVRESTTEKHTLMSFRSDGETFKIGLSKDLSYYVVYEHKDEFGAVLVKYKTSDTYLSNTLKDGEEPYIQTEYTLEYRVATSLDKRRKMQLNEVLEKYKGEYCIKSTKIVSRIIYLPKNYEAVEVGGVEQ